MGGQQIAIMLVMKNGSSSLPSLQFVVAHFDFTSLVINFIHDHTALECNLIASYTYIAAV